MSDMTFEGLGEMLQGDSADMCAGKFPLMLMGGRGEGLACANPGARTPIGVSGNSFHFQIVKYPLWGHFHNDMPIANGPPNREDGE